jgi:6-phosphofructokinase 1
VTCGDLCEDTLGAAQGTSRGGADIREIVKRIDMWAIDMLFVVGGNGGNAGAAAIQRECDKSGVTCSVISAPKSIDNDILRESPCATYTLSSQCK